MALMLGKLYEALREASVPEKSAREAAEEVAAFERTTTDLRTEVRVVQALLGVVSVLVIAVLWQLLNLYGQTGKLDERLASVGNQLGKLESRMTNIENQLTDLKLQIGTSLQRLEEQLKARP